MPSILEHLPMSYGPLEGLSFPCRDTVSCDSLVPAYYKDVCVFDLPTEPISELKVGVSRHFLSSGKLLPN